MRNRGLRKGLSFVMVFLMVFVVFAGIAGNVGAEEANFNRENSTRGRNNAPTVNFLGPNSGEVIGVIKINASVIDLEDNLDENGVKFYYSTDNEDWIQIGNDPTGDLLGEDNLYYEITWDTTLVSDGKYWLRAEAKDLTDLVGWDMSDDQIRVHNNLNNPPEITFKQPRKGVPLSAVESIVVEVIDLEDDVDSVSFYYSSDKMAWQLIGSKSPENNNMYNIIWNTEEMVNGEYYIKVTAIDKMGNSGDIIEGPFKITKGVVNGEKPNGVDGGGTITNETGNDKDEKKGFLPGFEFFYLMCSIIIIVLLVKKRYRN